MLNSYIDAIYKGLEPEFANLVKTYAWHKSAKCKTPNIEEIIEHRAQMANRWRINPEATAAEAVQWGGLDYLGNERNPEFCHGDPREIVERTCKNRSNWGLATWSKILAVRDPSKYFIFDARVSLAINKYCADAFVKVEFVFPILPSRIERRRLDQYEVIKKLENNGAKKFNNCAELYFDYYCPIIIGLANKMSADSCGHVFLFGSDQLNDEVRKNNVFKFGFDILPHLVEMALFMKGK